MQNHIEVISYWPSVSELAQDLGAGVEKVKKWKQRGRSPSTSWTAIVDAAANRGYPVDLQKLASTKTTKKRKPQ